MCPPSWPCLQTGAPPRTRRLILSSQGPAPAAQVCRAQSAAGRQGQPARGAPVQPAGDHAGQVRGALARRLAAQRGDVARRAALCAHRPPPAVWRAPAAGPTQPLHAPGCAARVRAPCAALPVLPACSAHPAGADAASPAPIWCQPWCMLAPAYTWVAVRPVVPVCYHVIHSLCAHSTKLADWAAWLRFAAQGGRW